MRQIGEIVRDMLGGLAAHAHPESEIAARDGVRQPPALPHPVVVGGGAHGLNFNARRFAFLARNRGFDASLPVSDRSVSCCGWAGSVQTAKHAAVIAADRMPISTAPKVRPRRITSPRL